MRLDDAIRQPRAITSNNGFWQLEEPLSTDAALNLKLRELGFNNIQRLAKLDAGVVTAVRISDGNFLEAAADRQRLSTSRAMTY
jgi:hypothetical protein